ncbi:MAG: bifunctional RNase H/acid phosphatase [Micrococcales bacterium]
MRRLLIEADGGSRGNPGPSGSGTLVIDQDTGEILVEIARFIGHATNNVAEYHALLAGVQAALRIDSKAELEVRMDSKLVIEQMSGGWKIKHPDMRNLASEIHHLLQGRPVRWQWIPREQNGRADALANRAMDSELEEVMDYTRVDSLNATQSQTPIASAVEFNAELPSSVRAPGGVTKPLTTVILVRHGRTVLTESKRISGSSGADPGLSEAGKSDARSVAKELSRFASAGPWKHLPPIAAVVSSPMKRTVETAQTIASEVGAQLTTYHDLREISFGDWDGLTNDEARESDTARFESWRGSWEVAPPNGESLRDFDDRIRSVRNQILEDFAGQTVVVVAHVMPIRGFLRQAFAADIDAYWRPQISPCSISILRLWGGEAAEIIAVNSTSHLA